MVGQMTELISDISLLCWGSRSLMVLISIDSLWCEPS